MHRSDAPPRVPQPDDAFAGASSSAGFPESLHSTHFQCAISLLARGYDFVVVDSPAILGSGDANVVEEAVDGVIIVTRSKHSKGSELREATKRLGDRKVVGAVIWDADVPQVRRP